MSGPKISEYELEQQRQQRLKEALEARKDAYCRAISERQNLLKQIQASGKILKSKLSKLEALKSAKTDNQLITSAYDKQITGINHVRRNFDVMIEKPIPKMDDITESESTECVQADLIKKSTKEIKTEFNRLLAEYSKIEQQAGEEIERERQRIEYNKAVEALKAQRGKSSEAIRQFADKLEELINSQASVPAVENAVSEIKSIRASLLDNANQLLRLSVPARAEDVRNLAAKTMRESNALMNMANYEIQGPLERIKSFAAEKEKVSRILDNFDAQQERADSSDALTKIADMNFTVDKDEEPDYYKTIEEDARKKLDSLLNQIEDAVCNDSVCGEDFHRLEELYLSIQETAKHSQKSLAAKIFQAEDTLAQVKLRAEGFEECYCKYATACEMLNQLYAANGDDHKKIEILDRLEYVSYEALRDEETRISSILVQENEQYFIRKTIKEVMRKFGFSMAEDFVLHREQKGAHLLCKMKNGDTAIHVHYGDGAKKRIMLEVVGVGKTPRGKLDDGVNGQIIESDALPERRRKQLLARQAVFCRIHPQIVQALEAEGILTSAVELSPPGIEFCEEIALADKEPRPEKKKIHKTRPAPQFMEKRMSKRKF